MLRSLGLQWAAVGPYSSDLKPVAPSSSAANVPVPEPSLVPLPGDGPEPYAAQAAAPPPPADASSPWSDSGGLVRVPFEAVRRLSPPGQDVDPAPSEGQPVVLDESSGL